MEFGVEGGGLYRGDWRERREVCLCLFFVFFCRREVGVAAEIGDKVRWWFDHEREERGLP